jgi:hypothetical protein
VVNDEIARIEQRQQQIKQTIQSQEKWLADLISNEEALKLADLMNISLRSGAVLIGPHDAKDLSAERLTKLRIMKTIFEWTDPGFLWDNQYIFTKLFPPGIFEAIDHPAESAKELHDLLTKHGPLYCSGALACATGASWQVVTHEDNSVKSGYTVASYITDSSHAVTVYGVNDDVGPTGMVEYADPWDFTTPRRVMFDVFRSHIRTMTYDKDKVWFLAVKCAGKDSVLQARQHGEW